MKFEVAIACPVCKNSLTETQSGLHCGVCSLTYPIRNGIPILIEGEARKGLSANNEFDYLLDAFSYPEPNDSRVLRGDRFFRVDNLQKAGNKIERVARALLYDDSHVIRNEFENSHFELIRFQNSIFHVLTVDAESHLNLRATVDRKARHRARSEAHFL